MRYIIILSFLLAGISCFGQANINADNIRWDVDSFVDMGDTTTHAVPSQFVSYSNNKIAWIQNSNYTMEYTVSSTTGTWADLAADGSMIFNVNYQTLSGSFKISRTNGVYEIGMEFLDENGKNTMPYVFHITNYTKL